MLTDEQILEIAENHHASHPGVDEWWEFRDRDDVVAFGRAILAASAGQAEPTEWSRTRSNLATAMAAFGTRPDGKRGMDAAAQALDAITEPGSPLSWLRDAAPTPAAAQGEPTVPQLLENADDVRRLLQSMHVSSSVFVDCEGNITGYKINTGALHKLFGMFGVVTYTGLPEIEEQPAAAPKQDEKPIPPTRDYESQVDESFAVVRAAVAAQDSCITNKFSSRVCERGTKSCNVEHAAAQDGPKCRACNGNDGDIPCAYPEGHPHCLRNTSAWDERGACPTGDQLRAIVRHTMDTASSPCDPVTPAEYVLAGWKAARAAASPGVSGAARDVLAKRIKTKLPSIRAKTGNALFDAGVHDACEKIESLLAEIERGDRAGGES